jgi:uncharacterized membrane protein YfcA
MQAALATEGLYWLALAVLIAGIVRGFTGFGSALVYLPVAAIFLPPAWVIVTMVSFSMFGPLPLLPRALREANKAEVLRLAVAGMVGIPIGVYLLTKLDPVAFRWIISGVSAVTLGVLVTGWRHSGQVTPKFSVIAGFVSGLMGGFVGLAGPPIILLYLSGRKAISEIRAVILLYLFTTDIVVMTTFLLRDLVTMEAFLVGVLLVPSYMLGGLLGQRLFSPKREALFRALAYGIILLAALVGLPVFS